MKWAVTHALGNAAVDDHGASISPDSEIGPDDCGSFDYTQDRLGGSNLVLAMETNNHAGKVSQVSA